MILCRLGLHDWTKWTKPVDHIQKRMCERCWLVQEVMNLTEIGYFEGLYAGKVERLEKLKEADNDNPT